MDSKLAVATGRPEGSWLPSPSDERKLLASAGPPELNCSYLTEGEWSV